MQQAAKRWLKTMLMIQSMNPLQVIIIQEKKIWHLQQKAQFLQQPKQNKRERLNLNTPKMVKFSQDCKQFHVDENIAFDELDAEALVNNSIIIEDEQESLIPNVTPQNAKRKLSLRKEIKKQPIHVIET